MNRLLRYEARKLFRSKALYILLGVGVLWVFVNLIATKSMPGPGGEPMVSDAWTSVKGSLSNGLFTILSAIFVSLFVCEEFNCGSIKNVYSRGYTRTEVYFAKYLISLLGTFFMVLVDILASFLISMAFWGKLGSMESTSWATLLTIVLFVIACHAFFYAIATLIRKTAGVLSINIVSLLGITLITSLGDTILKNNSFKIADWWIEGILTTASAGTDATKIYIGLGVLLVYIAAFIIAGYIPNRKRDLK